MNHNTLSRRSWLALGPAALGSAAIARAAAPPQVAEERSREEPFGYCLNTSTIQGQKLTIVEEVELAAKAGYQGIEPWIRELDQYTKQGGSLPDLRKRIADAGLVVPSVIGFFEWIVDDDAKRKKGLEEARRNFEMVQQIGGLRLAAPPVGATDVSGFDYAKAAERYRKLIELGEPFGVVPQVEVWGFSKTLGQLSWGAYVAVECGHPSACILADVYHLYKGGSSFAGLRVLGPQAMHVMHWNDYPADPPRATINDAARVYPGDGVAPLNEVVRNLQAIGYRGMLSLELFNRDLWKQDAMTVARTGLEKMRTAVRKGLTASETK